MMSKPKHEGGVKSVKLTTNYVKYIPSLARPGWQAVCRHHLRYIGLI